MLSRETLSDFLNFAAADEHTDEVLTKLGYSAEQVTKMRSGKIV